MTKKKKKPPKQSQHYVRCESCGKLDEPHMHCVKCNRWTDGVNQDCDDCLLKASRTEG